MPIVAESGRLLLAGTEWGRGDVLLLRSIPSSLDPAVVDTIDRRLDGVETDHRVRVLWAIESGSRAWGFASPDSDYDCRFLYVRHPDAYLSLWPERDVIETPLDAVFDVNGWDLAKAIRLIAKGNATAIEWLRSPIIYRGDGVFRNMLLAFASEVVERGAVQKHYVHVAHRQKAGPPSLKRVFYALRPAAALRWLDDHPDTTIPPMDLPTLLRESTAPDDVRDAVTELIALKAVTRELGAGEPPAIVSRFIDDELDRAAGFERWRSERDGATVRERADRLFREQLFGSV